ncbi:hypothetical protein GIB67_002329 [Kingdonia uniflora]|uniref:Uncharacterized protein n=1 Tax=Kingdonia uniflora TaxID=39325 RepID=A0A7J7KX74_9MAGN|nr:hypothetical protein GIB67_002329 [Kingdonia uniflora]
MVNDLMVEDDVKVNLEAISSKYCGGLLKKGDEKDNDDKKDVMENVKSEEEQPQVAEEEDSKPPTVVVYYNGKKMYNMPMRYLLKKRNHNLKLRIFEEVVGKAYQASAGQTAIVSIKEQTLEVEKTEDEASQASANQTTAVSIEEQTIEVAQADIVIFYQEEDIGEASQLVLMESEVDFTLKKRHALTEDKINEKAFIIACRMNQLDINLDELLPGVSLESFIQRPISQDKKNQVDQVCSLMKDELSPEARKDNMSTYMMVIDVYIKAMIQYFDT